MKYPTKIYVAGASAEIERAKKWGKHLRDAGLVVTSSWPEVIHSVGEANPRGATVEERNGWAQTDLSEVRAADVLWMLVPREAAGRGAYFEAGHAVASDKMLVCSGDSKQSIFCAVGSEFDDDMDAFTFIVKNARHGVGG